MRDDEQDDPDSMQLCSCGYCTGRLDMADESERAQWQDYWGGKDE